MCIGFKSLLLIALIVPTSRAELLCQTSNPALKAMGAATVSIHYQDGTSKRFKVKLADTAATRAAGFQGVCASTIAAEPILFVFQRSVTPNFHMRNVVAPIDIAFIDENGKIDSIQNMLPYVIGSRHRPLYGSEGPVIAALETHPGFFAKHRIDKSVKIEWQATPFE